MATSDQDLVQAATGEGFDPDRVWPDEPFEADEGDPGDDVNAGAPVVEVGDE